MKTGWEQMQSTILELKKVTSEPPRLKVHMQWQEYTSPMDPSILYMGIHIETGLSALLDHGNNQENIY